MRTEWRPWKPIGDAVAAFRFIFRLRARCSFLLSFAFRAQFKPIRGGTTPRVSLSLSLTCLTPLWGSGWVGSWHVTCEACRRRTVNTTENNSLHGVCIEYQYKLLHLLILLLHLRSKLGRFQSRFYLLDLFLLSFISSHASVWRSSGRAALRPHCAHPAGDSETTQKPQWREGGEGETAGV